MKRCPQCLQFSDDEALCCACGYDFLAEEAGDELTVVGKSLHEARAGARWFYWIAGLSLVNSVLAIFGVDVYFLIGLGMTELTRAIVGSILGVPMPNAGFEPWLLPALVIEAVMALAVAGLGWAASRGLGAAFVVGLLIYSLDTAYWALGRALPSVLLHVLAILFIAKGYLALRAARRAAASSKPVAPSVQWRRWAAVAGALAAFAPVVLLTILGWMVGVNTLVRDQILARAPESFSVAERERLESAFDAVDARFAEQGAISPEDARRMNAAMMSILDKPDQTVTREELLELTRILESVGGSSSDPPI